MHAHPRIASLHSTRQHTIGINAVFPAAIMLGCTAARFSHLEELREVNGARHIVINFADHLKQLFLCGFLSHCFQNLHYQRARTAFYDTNMSLFAECVGTVWQCALPFTSQQRMTRVGSFATSKPSLTHCIDRRPIGLPFMTTNLDRRTYACINIGESFHGNLDLHETISLDYQLAND